MMVEYLIKQNTIISHNDGAKYFNTESRDAWNKETPLGVNTRTNLWLTREGYHCTDFSKSFIVGEVSGDAEVDAAFLAQYAWDGGPLPQPMTPEIFIRNKNPPKSLNSMNYILLVKLWVVKQMML
jgi:hypothetical protein